MHNNQRGLVHSKAGCFQQEFSVRKQRILYEMRFAVVSYSIVGVCKTDFEGWPGLRNFVVPEVERVGSAITSNKNNNHNEYEKDHQNLDCGAGDGRLGRELLAGRGARNTECAGGEGL